MSLADSGVEVSFADIGGDGRSIAESAEVSLTPHMFVKKFPGGWMLTLDSMSGGD